MTSARGARSPSARLSRDAARTLGRQAFGTVLAFALSVVLARALGPSGNGRYALAILVTTALSSIFNLGLGPANVYFVGSGAISMAAARRLSLRAGILASAVVLAIGGCLLSLNLVSSWIALPRVYLTLALACFPLALIQQLLASLLQARSDFRRLNRVLLAVPVTNILLVSLATTVVGLTVSAALAAYAVALTVGLLASWRSVLAAEGNRYGSKPTLAQDGKRYLGKAFSYGWKAQLSNSVTMLVYRVDLVLVGAFMSTSAVGVYAVATLIAERLWMPSQAISTVLLPRLAELQNSETERLQLTPQVSRCTLALTTVCAGLLACLAAPLVRLAYGAGFESAVAPLLVLLPGVAMLSATRILANDLAARGRPGLNLAVSLVTLAVNLLANLLLIPVAGVPGAALATTIAYIFETIVLTVIYSRITRTPPLRCLLPTGQDARRLKELLASKGFLGKRPSRTTSF